MTIVPAMEHQVLSEDVGVVGMDPALWEVFESGAPDEEVSVIIRLARGASPPKNVRVVAVFGEIFTARVHRGEILTTRNTPGVLSLKAGRIVTPPPPVDDEIYSHDTHTEGASEGEAIETDPVEALEYVSENGNAENSEAAAAPAAAAVPASAGEDGRGVVVGVCDWGLDFTHPNFRNADGTTRVLALWDQRGFGDPLAPQPYNYGRLLTREMINAALAEPDPCAALGYHPASADLAGTGSHGTHVTDIVAGNRREPGSEVGLATASDIVFVNLAPPNLAELNNLGDSVTLLEGMDLIRSYAFTRKGACVLHLSAGKTGGPHRGDTVLERAVDAMLADSGIVLVQSVGNYADTAMHAHARVGPDQQHVLNWITPENDRTSNELEIWYSGQDVFDVTLESPDGRQFTAALDTRVRLRADAAVWGNFYHRHNEPNSGLNHIDIFLYTAAPCGQWRVILRGRDVVDGRLHAWIERDASGRYQSRFPRSQASSLYTTNTICNCFRAIAVGAYDSTQPDRPPTRFSSRGPTADGRQKPELAAPGYRIRAARSMPRRGWRQGESRLCVKSGTSMAAPWVSGTVALMFAAAGRPLTIHEIRRALIGTADPHTGPSGRTSTRLGYGYLNTAAAVAAARRLRAPDQAAARQAPQVREEEEMLTLESPDNGWGAIWVDEAAAGAEIGEPIVPEDVRVAAPREVEGAVDEAADEGCPCHGRSDVTRPEAVAEDEDDEGTGEWEDSALEAAAEIAPILWEDVRDAIDAVYEND